MSSTTLAPTPAAPTPAAPAPAKSRLAPPVAASEYIDRVRALAPMLIDAAGEIDRSRELPQPVVEALVEAGLFQMALPRSLGGAELPLPDYVPIIEEIAKADASAAWCVNQASGCSMTAAYMDPAAAREIFGEPRGIVAWGPGPGTARVVDGGYRVTAHWSFASGAHHASWLGCHVPIVEADGTPRLDSDGEPAIRTMLFPKTSTEFTDIWRTMGLRGTGSDKYSVTDLFVPARHSALRDDPDDRRERGLLYQFSSGALYSAGFAAVAMGGARATIDAFVELARDKIQRGAKRTMRDDNVTQSEVAQCEARLRSARTFLLRSLAEITEEAGRTGTVTLEQRMTIRLAATFAIHQSVGVVDMLYNAAGSTAIFNVNPFERRFRDVHSVGQHLQGRMGHYETVGQHMLGLEPDTLAWL